MSAEPITLTIKGACRLSSLSEPTIRRAISSGALPSYKVGKRRLIATDDLRAWLDSHRTEAKAQEIDVVEPARTDRPRRLTPVEMPSVGVA